jgi:nicotinate phosphoribosyltransferase
LAGRINVVAGLGTNLTDDCGVTPLNEVMKLIECCEHEGAPHIPCIKRSDDAGKRLGNGMMHAMLDYILLNAA